MTMQGTEGDHRRYDCPECGSENTQRATLAYESGTARSRAYTRGGGTHDRTEYGAVTEGEGRTLLATRLAPPKPRRVVAGTIGFFVLGLYVELITHSTVVLFGVWVPAAVYAVWAVKQNRRLAEKRREWAQQFVCMRCGEKFDPTRERPWPF